MLSACIRSIFLPALGVGGSFGRGSKSHWPRRGADRRQRLRVAPERSTQTNSLSTSRPSSAKARVPPNETADRRRKSFDDTARGSPVTSRRLTAKGTTKRALSRSKRRCPLEVRIRATSTTTVGCTGFGPLSSREARRRTSRLVERARLCAIRRCLSVWWASCPLGSVLEWREEWFSQRFGSSCFSSSAQLSTMRICRCASGGPLRIIRKRVPSGDTS